MSRRGLTPKGTAALGKALWLAVAVLLCVATTVWARQAEPAALAPAAVSSGQMPDPSQGLMRIDVTVTDKSGKPLPELSQEDFTLLDNGRKQKIVTFQAFNGGIQPASALEVALVIDELNILSGGPQADVPMSDRDAERHAAETANHKGEGLLRDALREVETFLRANGGALQAPTMIYRLTADGLFATAHPSRDGNELVDEMEQPGRLRRIWSPSMVSKDIGDSGKGGSANWRISHSIVALGSISIEERRRPGRKLLFWIGNAWQIENRSAAGLSNFSSELMTRMREARITVWGASQWPLSNSNGSPAGRAGYDSNGEAAPVGDFWPVTDYVDKEYLEGPRADTQDLGYLSLPVIAARSGGAVLDARHHQLAGLIGKYVKEQRTFYSITFDPTRTNVVDEYHHLHLEVDKPGLTTHALADYYDEPVFYDQPPARKAVSVKELELLLANGRSLPESELAHQLDAIELTERLGRTQLAALAESVHGNKPREALEVLADESLFLAPPADEISAAPAPDAATQHQFISLAITYINTTMPMLPDFFATRKTVQYHEPLPKPGQTWKTAGPDQSLLEGETATANLEFRDGKEREEKESVKGNGGLFNASLNSDNEQLKTVGTFGPILAAIMTAATMRGSELEWSRWEKGEDGRLAVFRYRVPQETQYFYAAFCCLARDFEETPFRKSTPFHGEIAMDPSSGAILRLTIQADLEWRLPLDQSDVVVEYRPEVKDTKTFICPSRSVSISRHRRTMILDEWGELLKVYAPFETLLNEMRFEKYRIFGTTTTILPGFVEVPKEVPKDVPKE